MFGENASCELFGPDASGRSENGWASQGPASSITVAAPVSGETGAHSIYVRSVGGVGNAGQIKGMRQLLSHALKSLDKGKSEQACAHLQHFIDATGHNVVNGSLESAAASSLSIEASIIKDELGCS